MKALAVLMLLAGPAAALDISLPFPEAETFVEARPLGSHAFATGPHDGSVPVETVEGAVTRRVWQLASGGATVLEILAPIRDALARQGWAPGFTCETRACGGYDFRFALDVTPAPEMFVNLADFRYLTMSKPPERLDLLVSRSGALGYVQLTHVGAAGSVEAITKSASNTAPALAVTGDIAAGLAGTGRAVLDDLAFQTGSTELVGERYASLAELAAFLKANPDTTIALVGHTDAEGGAEGNMAISRRRADAAKARLTTTHGIAPGRIDTFGVGFFSPLAPNDTDAGRALNRRVEAVITSTPDR